jgi:hypothetical protein
MKKHFHLFACVLYVCLISPAVCFGRLGETEEELERRYGRPFHETTDADSMPPGGEKKLAYLKDNITVHVTLFRGRSVSEGYEFKDGDRNPTPIEGEVLEKAIAILDANSQGHEWDRHPSPARSNPNFFQVWNRTDGNAVAIVWRNKSNMLELTDMEFMRESNRARRANAAGASGF